MRSLEQRFLAKFTTDKSCWIWSGARNRGGYGVLRTGGPRTDQRKSLAHRVSWQVHFGTIPIDMDVLHRCDVPLCVNPGHLFLGTQADNNRDMHSKGRGVYVGRQGSAHHSAKISESDVTDIRALRAFGARGVDLAREFNVSQSTISTIVSGKYWCHV